MTEGYEPDIARLQLAHEQLQTEPKQAISELEQLAEMGSAKAPLYLGWACQKGDGTPPDQARAEHWYKMSVARGDTLSTYFLGNFYAGSGRYAEANLAFEEGCRRGDAPSTYCLAMNLLEGKPAPENAERARSLLETASAQGHVFALRALASLYISGKFGTRKIAYGVWLLAKAVASGAWIAIRSTDDDRLRA